MILRPEMSPVEVPGKQKQQSNDAENARGSSLYVGGLEPRVCTELLHDVFSLAGEVIQCRVVSDKHTGASMGFGFVDYSDHPTALKAQKMFHGRSIYGQDLTVDWAHANSNAAAGRGVADRSALTSSAEGGDKTASTKPDSDAPAAGRFNAVSKSGEDISNHYCLFIGNLDTSVSDDDLYAAFSVFGDCSSAQVSRDAALNSRRCAFVSFRERSVAQAAIDGLNGQIIASRPMRVDWARTKTNAATRAAAMGLPDVDPSSANWPHGAANGISSSTSAGGANNSTGPTRQPLDFVTILSQTSPAVTTAYISGLPPDVDDATLREAFGSYGVIVDVRIPESSRNQGGDKIYAFVIYTDHESAARAIFESQGGRVVAGRQVIVQWGREGPRPNSMSMHGRRGMQHPVQRSFGPPFPGPFPGPPVIGHHVPPYPPHMNPPHVHHSGQPALAPYPAPSGISAPTAHVYGRGDVPSSHLMYDASAPLVKRNHAQ